MTKRGQGRFYKRCQFNFETINKSACGRRRDLFPIKRRAPGQNAPPRARSPKGEMPVAQHQRVGRSLVHAGCSRIERPRLPLSGIAEGIRLPASIQMDKPCSPTRPSAARLATRIVALARVESIAAPVAADTAAPVPVAAPHGESALLNHLRGPFPTEGGTFQASAARSSCSARSRPPVSSAFPMRVRKRSEVRACAKADSS